MLRYSKILLNYIHMVKILIFPIYTETEALFWKLLRSSNVSKNEIITQEIPYTLELNRTQIWYFTPKKVCKLTVNRKWNQAAVLITHHFSFTTRRKIFIVIIISAVSQCFLLTDFVNIFVFPMMFFSNSLISN